VAQVAGSLGADPAQLLSIVGIAKAYVDAGTVARNALEDRASTHPTEI